MGNREMNSRSIAEQIFLAGVESVLPDRLIAKVMELEDNDLKIEHLSFNLERIENIYVIGAGKASAMMGAEVEKILGDRIAEGHIVVKYGHSCKLKYINVSEAGHPVPDANGFRATREIINIAESASWNDLVICLLSGGGSSLLPDIPGKITAAEMMKLNGLLINSGACISEINAVRKHLSEVKGGHLARIVYPATLVNLILSDVPGDPLDVIASGPTVPDPTTFHQALEVLEKFGLTDSVPQGVIEFLSDGVSGKRPETPKPDDPVFNNTFNILVGSNRMALEAARSKSLEFNINAVILDDQLQGDITTISEYLVETAIKFKNDKNEVKPVCLLLGGETTVKMTGKGTGGRNQHLALSSAQLLLNNPGITILSAGTDGNDGPTDVAGAVVDSETVPEAISKNIDPEKHLSDFNSFHFFKKAGGQIITGPTMTNVMDIIVVIVE
jgi:hydroxypyruvate reductase/glycerate 2-kinase